MIKRSRYRKIPNPNKRKRERRSQPLKRSVHIDGKRWGWEFDWDRRSEDVLNDSKVKILSPENDYYAIKIKDTPLYGDVVTPGTVKQFIMNNLVFL